MKNWRTTLWGAAAGLPQLIKGIMLKDPVLISTGLSTMLMGLFAKDTSVTGVGA